MREGQEEILFGLFNRYYVLKQYVYKKAHYEILYVM